MKIFPGNSREWWALIFLPPRAYVLIAPVAFLIWDVVTAGHRFRGAWGDALGIIGMGYMICFLVFAIAGLASCVARDTGGIATSFLFASLAFLFPMGMISRLSPLIVSISIFIVACKFARNYGTLNSSALQNEEAFDCPACNALISSREQKCSKCGWTYVV